MQKTVHIQFDKKSKYLGKVDPTQDIKDGHFNIEVSHDEHEDVEKNKENADHIAKFLGGKSKIDNEKRLEGLVKVESTYPLFGDTDMDTVRQKVKQHGRNPDTLKQGESVHLFTHKHEGNVAQVHYDPHIDKYKVLAKSSSTKGVHMKFFNKVENAHAHAKAWVKKPVNESMDYSIELDESSVPTEQSLLEISKEKLKNYIRANVEDRLLRQTGASFKSGKSGDEYNKADETETDEKRKKGMDKAMDKLTKESFGANILASIINNKPIEAQEKFGAAMSSILKTRIDDMRQDVAKRVFNNVQEKADDWEPEEEPKEPVVSDADKEALAKNGEQTRKTLDKISDAFAKKKVD